MAATTINGLDELLASVGTELGASDWMEITQDRVNAFADATGDHQWIHVDVERANAESPFGGPIAHGYLTMSLISNFLPELVVVTGISAGINYGANKVRFPAPVPVGSRIRARATLSEATEVAGGVQTTIVVTVEVEGADKPGCVAEVLSRWLA